MQSRLAARMVSLIYALRGLSVIEDIPTELFNRIPREHLDAGWKKVWAYEGTDAWIDYGRVDLKRASTRIRFEWDNWFEGRIRAPRAVSDALIRTYGLTQTRGPLQIRSK